MDDLKRILRRMKDTFTLADLVEAFFGGLLSSLLIIAPLLLLIINLAFLYVAYIRLYVILGVLVLAVFGALWSLIAYKILRIRRPDTDIPLETLRWIEAALTAGIILIAGIPIGLIIVSNAY